MTDLDHKTALVTKQQSNDGCCSNQGSPTWNQSPYRLAGGMGWNTPIPDNTEPKQTKMKVGEKVNQRGKGREKREAREKKGREPSGNANNGHWRAAEGCQGL